MLTEDEVHPRRFADRRSWRVVALVLGVIVGAAVVYEGQPHFVVARSAISGRDHYLFFEEAPTESDILDAVLLHDPWRPKGSLPT